MTLLTGGPSPFSRWPAATARRDHLEKTKGGGRNSSGPQPREGKRGAFRGFRKIKKCRKKGGVPWFLVVLSGGTLVPNAPNLQKDRLGFFIQERAQGFAVPARHVGDGFTPGFYARGPGPPARQGEQNGRVFGARNKKKLPEPISEPWYWDPRGMMFTKPVSRPPLGSGLNEGTGLSVRENIFLIDGKGGSFFLNKKRIVQGRGQWRVGGGPYGAVFRKPGGTAFLPKKKRKGPRAQ